VLARGDGGAQPGAAAADHHNVRFDDLHPIP
jgi:hypothetical protein